MTWTYTVTVISISLSDLREKYIRSVLTTRQFDVYSTLVWFYDRRPTAVVYRPALPTVTLLLGLSRVSIIHDAVLTKGRHNTQHVPTDSWVSSFTSVFLVRERIRRNMKCLSSTLPQTRAYPYFPSELWLKFGHLTLITAAMCYVWKAIISLHFDKRSALWTTLCLDKKADPQIQIAVNCYNLRKTCQIWLTF